MIEQTRRTEIQGTSCLLDIATDAISVRDPDTILETKVERPYAWKQVALGKECH